MRTIAARLLLVLCLLSFAFTPVPVLAVQLTPADIPIPAVRYYKAALPEITLPLAAPLAGIQVPAAPLTFTVNSTGDEPDANTADTICETAPGNATCTLRAAIETVNARTTTAPDTIRFAIGSATSNFRTINVTETLPIIWKWVNIIGPNVVGGVFADLYINGSQIVDADTYNQNGFSISADHVHIANLEIWDFPDSGIDIAYSSYVTVTGTQVRRGRFAISPRGNETGISIRASDNIQIGGSTTGQRNVVAGSNSRGINLFNSDYITVENNYIGLKEDGTTLSGNEYGVFIDGGIHNRILNNVIAGNSKDGIHLQKNSLGYGNAEYTVIAGNKIGTDASGTLARPNGVGIQLTAGSNYTVVGGNTASERNLISGNTYSGIDIPTGDTLGVQIIGNYIGTNAAGTAALPNRDGLTVASYHTVTIGGITPNEGNLISGNTDRGIYLHSDEHIVSYNKIGTNAAGSAALGNGGHGIEVNSVPGYIGRPAPLITQPGDNIIAYNGGSGISLALHAPTAIYGNRIYGNAGLGIDYGADGPTPNARAGASPAITDPVPTNRPLLTSVVVAGSTVTITGYIDTASSITATIQFYVSDGADPSGCGEGQDWVGSTVVTTDVNGRAAFSAVFTAGVVRSAHYAATASIAGSRTSEFSCQNVIEYKALVPLVLKN